MFTRTFGAALGMACCVALLTGCSSVADPKPLPLPKAGHFEDLKVDLDYATASAAQRLDLYLPERDRPAPVVIMIHGGWWMSGDKADIPRGSVDALRKAGYAVASVNYRLATEAAWPAGVQDVKAAVRWLRAQASEYYLDPERFAVAGTSAGGYLAAAVGVSGAGTTGFDDPRLGNPQVSSAVQAASVWSAPTNFATLDKQLTAAGCPAVKRLHGLPGSFESRWLGKTVSEGSTKVRQSNLLGYAAEGQLPPFQIVHRTGDCTVPAAQSKALDRALRQAGGTSTLSLLKGTRHEEKPFTGRRLQSLIKFLGESLRPA